MLEAISSFIWSQYLLIPLLGITGIYLTVGLRFLPWRNLAYALTLVVKRESGSQDGDISPFQALATALSATVGTGNIAGVATAIYAGGPGAVFWMWVIALFGMATKYAEAVLAVHFRQRDANGNFTGGPMVYIRQGLGESWQWMASAFAVFAAIAAFGIGNTVQANSVADALESAFSVPPWVTGVVAAIVIAAVVLGGISRIAKVAASVVPAMAAIYVIAALAIIAMHFGELPTAFALIIKGAFSGTAASGGFLGATVWMALRFGVARGIFSNESGLGSAAIAHAAARTSSPTRQGMIAMLGTFIDTICICTLTALVILVTGVWNGGEQGAAMSTAAFSAAFGGVGSAFIAVGLVAFAFTTMIGWSYYGERSVVYLFGVKAVLPFRLLWIAAALLGAIAELDLVWILADIFNGLMAIPNLIALLVLSPLVFRLTREATDR